MRVPVAWLEEFIPLPELSTLAERLTLGGLEVEAVEPAGPDLSGIRVGSVVACDRHPNADRLSLCRVKLGEGEAVEIVCGAPNVAAGQKVAVASPGQRLPDGTKLKRAKIRGVVSDGMICSARELGVGDDAQGILVLDPNTPVGARLADVWPRSRGVLEIALTPNRGDCASLLGVAREVRAHFGGEIRLPPCDAVDSGEATEEAVQVSIDDPEGCFWYVARLVRGVRVRPSPAWLRDKLEEAGMRAINSIVDVTNLVMLELGQPLHAFDWSHLRGEVVRVRRAASDEKLVTLDGQNRALEPEDLVIADAERPIAIAGVMGGVETEVGAETRDILIESAHFHPVRVRRTARRFGLQTEASYRFERGVDREGVRRAADRAARLIVEIAGGEVARGVAEARGRSLETTEAISLPASRVNRILGTELEPDQMAELLGRVDVTTSACAGGTLRCRIPSYRNDLGGPEDLIEEVARVHGYERIPTTLPTAALTPPKPARLRRLGDRARDVLCGLGLVECMSFPFSRPDDADRLGLEADDLRRRTVRLLNPLVEEEPELRATLVPSLLRLVRLNQSRQAERVCLFEVSRVFLGRGGSELPEEPLHVAAVLAEESEPRLWKILPAAPPLFQVKGLAERLVEELGFEVSWSTDGAEPYLHPQAALSLEVDGERVGVVGELHPETAARFEVEGGCTLLVVDLSLLAQRRPAERHYAEISRQPRVRRDLAVLLPREVAAGDVLEAIRREAGAWLTAVEIFDRYEGKGVPEGRVSVAFRLVFQRPDRALTDREVAKTTDRLVAMLAQRFHGELR